MGIAFLKLNSSKSEVIICVPKRLQDDIRIERVRLDNNHILNVEGSVKLLGIHLDTSLTFNGHISMILSQCYSLIRNIAKMRKLLAIDALKKLSMLS